ncbi:MAG: hypothetical protein ABH880_02955 [Patescibacteria group bacterium]
MSAVSRTLSVHQEHELLTKLEAAGLLSEDAQRIIQSRSNTLAKRVVDFIRRGGYTASTDERLARLIMGTNFLGIEEASRHFGVSFTQKQTRELAEIPFTEAELEAVKETHVLVACYPMSILEIREAAPKLFYQSQYVWYDSDDFADEKAKLGWLLVRKDIVPGSTDKTWDEQQAMLAENEETPRAVELIYSLILYALATGERLMPNVYARTTTVHSGGYHVYVGGFGAFGLRVGSTWDDDRWDGLGVSSARKSN